MPKEKDIPFLPLIKETFGQVFEEYDFQIQDEAEWNGHGEYSVVVSKENIKLIFFLSVVPLFYYFDFGIKLSGELAKEATPNLYYQNHSIGVTVIAQCLDPNYRTSSKGIQTTQELREALNHGKEDLLKYCKGFLVGDVSSWSKVVDCLIEKRK